PVWTFQMRTLVSSFQCTQWDAANVSPSGEKATAVTPPACPGLNDRSSRPDWGSQSRTTGSPRNQDEVAAIRPSGEKETQDTGPACPGKGSICLPVAVSHCSTACGLLPPPGANTFA